MSEKLWYAVMRDEFDDDWGTGYEDRESAVELALHMRRHGEEKAYIAVIADGRDPVCIGTITDLED